MSAFLESISVDQSEVRAIHEFNKDPFRQVPIFHGGYTHHFHYHFDRTDVKLEALKKLSKTVKYVPLKEITPKFNVRSYFTIGCVLEVSKTSILLGDLKCAKKVIRAEEFPAHIHQYDFVAVANADINYTLKIRGSDQIIRIGHSNNIKKCSHYGTSQNCSDYIDSRDGPHCEFHCHELVLKTANDRPMLKLATTQMRFNTPLSSPQRYVPLVQKSTLKIPDDYIEKYYESHSSGRAARLNRHLNKDKPKPQIAMGYTSGDIIVL